MFLVFETVAFPGLFVLVFGVVVEIVKFHLGVSAHSILDYIRFIDKILEFLNVVYHEILLFLAFMFCSLCQLDLL